MNEGNSHVLRETHIKLYLHSKPGRKHAFSVSLWEGLRCEDPNIARFLHKVNTAESFSWIWVRVAAFACVWPCSMCCTCECLSWDMNRYTLLWSSLETHLLREGCWNSSGSHTFVARKGLYMCVWAQSSHPWLIFLMCVLFFKALTGAAVRYVFVTQKREKQCASETTQYHEWLKTPWGISNKHKTKTQPWDMAQPALPREPVAKCEHMTLHLHPALGFLLSQGQNVT